MKSLPPEVIAEIDKVNEEFKGDDIPRRAFTVQDYYLNLKAQHEENGLALITDRQCGKRLHKLVENDPCWHKGRKALRTKWYFWKDEGG